MPIIDWTYRLDVSVMLYVQISVLALPPTPLLCTVMPTYHCEFFCLSLQKAIFAFLVLFWLPC